jgi:hypothetical protein
MMNARARRDLIDEMVNEYDINMVKALMSTISDHTGKSCPECADIVLEAWSRSKHPEVDSECYDTAAVSLT